MMKCIIACTQIGYMNVCQYELRPVCRIWQQLCEETSSTKCEDNYPKLMFLWSGEGETVKMPAPTYGYRKLGM